jgi:hypothetical protein
MIRAPDDPEGLVMKRTSVLAALVAVSVAALVPATAVARKSATKSQRSAILAAIVKQHQLSKAQASCQVVTISTVNSSYADATWPKRLSSECEKVAGNGVIVEHLQNNAWHFVAVGSSFQCPIKGVPTSVARDLGVCS